MGPVLSALYSLKLVQPLMNEVGLCFAKGRSGIQQFPPVAIKAHLLTSLPRNSTVLNSKVISVTVKPFPRSLLTPLEIEFSHLYNVSLSWEAAPPHICVLFLPCQGRRSMMALLAWGNTGIFDPHSHHFTVRHSCGQKKNVHSSENRLWQWYCWVKGEGGERLFWLMLAMFLADTTRDLNIIVVVSAVKGRWRSPLGSPGQPQADVHDGHLHTPRSLLVVDFRCPPEALEHEY